MEQSTGEKGADSLGQCDKFNTLRLFSLRPVTEWHKPVMSMSDPSLGSVKATATFMCIRSQHDASSSPYTLFSQRITSDKLSSHTRLQNDGHVVRTKIIHLNARTEWRSFEVMSPGRCSIRLPVGRVSWHEIVVEEWIQVLEWRPTVGPTVPALEHYLIDWLGTIDSVAGWARCSVTLVNTVQYFLPGHAWSEKQRRRGRHRWSKATGDVIGAGVGDGYEQMQFFIKKSQLGIHFF